MKLSFAVFAIVLGSMFVGVHTAAAADASGLTGAVADWTVTDGASQYNIYYRESANAGWTHSVWTGPNTTSITIDHLSASTTYYYKVAAVVNGNEVWQAEKMLYSAVPSEPVLGIFDDIFGKKSLYEDYSDEPEPSLPLPEDESYMQMNGIGGDEVYDEDDTYESYDPAYEQMNNVEFEPVSYDEPVVYEENTLNVPPSRNDWGNATWSSPNQTVSKYHIYYWSAADDRHAVRDLSPQSQMVTISALNTGRAYAYQVEAILTDGQSVWVTGVLPLN